jgi:hypothetical protein
MNKLHDLKSPATGKVIPWVPAVATDIRATFERARAELAAQKKAKSNVQTFRGAK